MEMIDLPDQPSVDTIEFVGGPWAGEREPDRGQTEVIPASGGTYHPSVRCADDGALRYVWNADLDPLAR